MVVDVWVVVVVVVVEDVWAVVVVIGVGVFMVVVGSNI